MMNISVLQGILIPFFGTVLGSACVFFMKGQMSDRLNRALTGFASGIMVSASFFSLLKPSLEQTAAAGGLAAFMPAVSGFLVGMLFLLLLDNIIPHIHLDNTREGPQSRLKKTTMMMLAVTLHNLPEGMAVGIVYAGWMYGNEQISMAGALSLALGIALQNFPEGAIISMPLRAEGMPKMKTFLCGVLSGIVEPIGAMLVILAAGVFVPMLPFLLAFAAGAMFYVVVEELIPDMSSGEHSNIGTICFAVGFALMMALDVGLG